MGKSVQRHFPASVHPGQRPGTHCSGSQVSLGAGMDGCWRILSHRDPNPKQYGL